ncbi:MAG: DUF4147 domain-containing protein, partial [Deltaproteobacteria bacterium]|nr:DUF4147 domain-containing protein [Deltaproteobacteria bacterium]
MKKEVKESFLKRVNERKGKLPAWQGHRLGSDWNATRLSELQNWLDEVFDHLLSELDPYQRVLNSISFDGKRVSCGGVEATLEHEGRVIVVGGGKASHQMAQALYEIFGERASGVVTTHKDMGSLPPFGNITLQPA